MDARITIESQRTITLQYYVPFYFDDDLFAQVNDAFAAARRTRTEKPQWQAAAFPVPDNPDIYAHVLSMMNVRPNENSLCRSWQYMDAEGSLYLLRIPGGKEIEFSIQSIYTHLFKTGIGFFSYQIVIDKANIDDAEQLIMFQHRIKEITRTVRFAFRLRQIYEQPAQPDDPEDVLETLRQRHGPQEMKEGFVYARTDQAQGMHQLFTAKPLWLAEEIARLLRSVYPNLHFFAAIGKNLIPDKALMFSYICYQCPDRTLLRQITVHMSVGYGVRQHMPESMIGACQELSENVYAFISQEGCAISVCPDELNRDFFVNQPPTRLYNFIYFTTLYQHYSLMNYTMRIVHDFPSDTQAYLQDAAYADKMQMIITDINTFLMKSDVATISHIQYHNIFYSASRAALNIENDKQSLRSGFEYLVNIQKSLQQAQRERQHQQEQQAMDERWMQQEADRLRQEERWRKQDKRHQREMEQQNERDGRLDKFVNYIAILTFIGESGNFIRLIRDVINKVQTGLDTWDLLSVGLSALMLFTIILIMRFKHRRQKKREKALEKKYAEEDAADA